MVPATTANQASSTRGDWHSVMIVSEPFTVAYGRDIEDRLRRQIATFTDIPLVLDVRACIDAIHCLDMARVLMVAPERSTS